MMRVQEKAFDIGRAIGKHPLASRLFCLVERFLPLQRLARSGTIVAFRHPRPSFDPHILVVPTVPFPSLDASSLTIARKSAILWEMATVARSLADPAPAQWQMVINGGVRQDIGQVHGHLIRAEGDRTATGWTLRDPRLESEGWESLFDRIHQATGVPGNGFSVTFRFAPNNCLVASFSESARS